MKHSNISIFVPHAGCPNMCSFCNQRCITGETHLPKKEDVFSACETAAKYNSDSLKDTQLAYFGGSFTAIDRSYMMSLLEWGKECVDKYGFNGIRISTRPDAIDEEILDILKSHEVKAIELGAQSLDTEVLLLNKRGHTADDVVKSSKLIKDAGFELGLQMMTGLNGDTPEKSIETAKKFIALRPKTVRIYPTIVVEGTELGRLYKEGKYTPETLDEAVDLASTLIGMFMQEGIDVIRVGLHSEEDLKHGYIAGPLHPAFRELCENKYYYNKILSLAKEKGKNDITIYVNDKCISKAVGQHRINIDKLADQNIKCTIKTSKKIGKYMVSFTAE